MPNNDLTIGVTVQKPDMDGVEEVIASGTSNIGVSFDGLASRTKRAMQGITDDVKTAAQHVTAESLRIAEATKAQAAAIAMVKNALIVGKDKNADAAASTALLAATQERAAFTARQLAAAQESVAVATSHVVPQMAASSGAIRVFEGTLPIRAVERFLGTTLGLGPIIANMFPLVGAIALTEMLFKVGAEIYKAEERARNLKQAIDEAFTDLNRKMQESNDELAVTNDKLADTIAKYEHRPENNLKLGLDEARVSADKLATSLQNDIKEMVKLLAAEQTSFISRTVFDQASNKSVGAGAKRFQDRISGLTSQGLDEVRGAKDPAAQAAARAKMNTSYLQAYDSELTTLGVEIAKVNQRQKDFTEQSQGTRPIKDTVTVEDQSILQETLNKYKQNLLLQRDAVQLRITNQELELKVGQEKPAKKGPKDNAAELRMRAFETEMAEEKAERSVSIYEERAYWIAKKAAFSSGSTEYLAVVRRVAELTKEARSKESEIVKQDRARKRKEATEDSKAEEELQKTVQSALLHSAEDVLKTGERWREYHAEIARGVEIEAHNTATLRETQIAEGVAEGSITRLSEARQMAKLHTAEYIVKMKQLDAELKRIAADGNLTKEQKETQSQGVQNNITQLSGQNSVQGAKDQNAIAQALAAPYLKGFDAIGQAWKRTMSQLLSGQTTVARAFAQMGASLVQSVVSSLEEMAIKWIEHEIRTLAQHVASNQAKVASDAAAKAQQVTIAGAGNVAMVTGDAGVAAAGALAYYSAISPPIAPAMAALAFAETMAYAPIAAFELGGVVSGSPGMAVPIIAHAGERVLTPKQTQTVEKLADGTASAVAPRFHMPISITLNGGATQADANRLSDAVHDAVRKGLRNWQLRPT